MSEFEEQYLETEITCPYCKYAYSDSWEKLDEGEEECVNCGKNFRYCRQIEVTYNCIPDCLLNQREHSLEDAGRYLECSVCGFLESKERTL